MREIRFDRFEAADLAGGPWVGPWVDVHPFAELVASWNLPLPPGAVLDVAVQIRRGTREGAWYVLGRWADGPPGVRTSLGGQKDKDAEVLADTLVVRGAAASGYRLRLVLSGAAGASCTPTLVAAMASSEPRPAGGAVSSFAGIAVELDVPPMSQQEQRGVYRHLDGGGESWCSPTSTAMVLSFWGCGPSVVELAGIGAAANPIVAHAALNVFDPDYGGAGNWSFNVAYAGRFGLEAFVTRLRSLAEAELFLASGIPLVLSIATPPGELDGFPIPQGTQGHLLVLVGVTGGGDAVVNDPAAASAAEVRRTYRRAELERAWLHGSGGVVYVIRPPGTVLPPGRGNW